MMVAQRRGGRGGDALRPAPAHGQQARHGAKPPLPSSRRTPGAMSKVTTAHPRPGVMDGVTVPHPRHPRAGGNPDWRTSRLDRQRQRLWLLASAGMTVRDDGRAEARRTRRGCVAARPCMRPTDASRGETSTPVIPVNAGSPEQGNNTPSPTGSHGWGDSTPPSSSPRRRGSRLANLATRSSPVSAYGYPPLRDDDHR